MNSSLKWYTAYKNTSDGFTYFFDTHEKAVDHAYENGEFHEIYGKENCMDHEMNLFFDVPENEVNEYSPYLVLR